MDSRSWIQVLPPSNIIRYWSAIGSLERDVESTLELDYKEASIFP